MAVAEREKQIDELNSVQIYQSRQLCYLLRLSGLENHKIVQWSWGLVHHEIYWSFLICTGPQIKG